MAEIDRVEARVAAQISERKKEAISKKLYDKAVFVAEVLGEKSKYYNDDTDENTINYKVAKEDASIIIEYHKPHESHGRKTWEESNVSILKGNKNSLPDSPSLFYCVNNEILGYIPGEWEKELDKLYAQAIEIQKEKEKAKKDLKLQERLEQLARSKSNFGL
jgi:hypothetical protein